MRRRQPVIAALLALALLLGQWLAAAHQPDHALKPGAHACGVCAYAQGLDTGALPVAWLPTFHVEGAALPAEAPALLSTAAFRHQPIRGPPTLLA